jgi:hypothetical protein
MGTFQHAGKQHERTLGRLEGIGAVARSDRASVREVERRVGEERLAR